MKYLYKIVAMLMILALLAPVTVVYAQEQVGQELGKKAEEIEEDVIFDNISALAGPACGLYGLGLNLINFAYDGQWSFIFSLLDITVLFRNNNWRELLWAMEDQRKAWLEESIDLEKKKCAVELSGLATSVYEGAKEAVGDAAGVEEDDPEERAAAEKEGKITAKQVFKLEKDIAELEGKIEYFGQQRWSMYDLRPNFIDPNVYDVSDPNFEALLNSRKEFFLQTDKLFYWLMDIDDVVPDVFWPQLRTQGEDFATRTVVDWAIIIDQIPEGCFVKVDAYNQIDNFYTNSDYTSLSDYLKANSGALANYITKLCEGDVEPTQELDAELQLKVFMEAINVYLERAEAYLTKQEEALLPLEQKKLSGEELSEEEEEELEALLHRRGTAVGMVEYYSLIIRKVGATTTQNLTKMFEALTNFVEAVLGVTSDDEGNLDSRISIADRFEKRRKKKLQDICSRIEGIYAEAGRSLDDLPVLGVADGEVYCRAKPNCADVDLTNIVGGSKGFKKLGECMGFGSNGEKGPSQITPEVLDADSDDVGTVLAQRSRNDLLKSRNLHFTAQRATYKGLYEAKRDFATDLEQLLADVEAILYNPEEKERNPDKSGAKEVKSHHGLLLKIYRDFWDFAEQQEGTCEAPQKIPE